ncbi:acetyl-CoA carboxylase biotin carboxyl carrier protein [Halobacillus seohaensis]|uniref:Biotin carboxyl carrier protein of acetyl-CoA carboxylase n=1 Tax=Halobacillus seohaensis TaxID=447421 RepID=A0ABW2EJJ2_9BACI
MLKVQEIRELIKLIDHSQIDEFSYEANGTKVSMKKSGGQVVTEVPTPEEVSTPKAEAVKEQTSQPKQDAGNVEDAKEEPVSKTEFDKEITSPMVGTFYKSPSPDQDAYVKVGDKVKEDSIVCIVEAMKLFNEIEAEATGEVVEILAEDGELIEYGQPLFRVKTS